MGERRESVCEDTGVCDRETGVRKKERDKVGERKIKRDSG